MTRGCEWRHASEVWAEDFQIWKNSVSWVLASEEEDWHSGLVEARRICALRVPCVGWVESWWCKSSQYRKIVSLSSCRKAFKLKKAYKSFVSEPISCFRIPIYFYEHFMNIQSISHIRIIGMLHIVSIIKQTVLRMATDVGEGKLKVQNNSTPF